MYQPNTTMNLILKTKTILKGHFWTTEWKKMNMNQILNDIKELSLILLGMIMVLQLHFSKSLIC